MLPESDFSRIVPAGKRGFEKIGIRKIRIKNRIFFQCFSGFPGSDSNFRVITPIC